jgi:hypothetical protein
MGKSRDPRLGHRSSLLAGSEVVRSSGHFFSNKFPSIKRIFFCFPKVIFFVFVVSSVTVILGRSNQGVPDRLKNEVGVCLRFFASKNM